MDQSETLDFIKKYTEDLLTFYGVNVEVEVEVRDDFVDVTVPANDETSLLIGRNAETLRAIQYLLSTVLRNAGSSLVRVNLDIAGYKQQRAEKIAEQAREWIAAVRETGDSHVARINAADRRIVHQVAMEYDDIRTFSEGEGRDRAIIIAQKTS